VATHPKDGSSMNTLNILGSPLLLGRDRGLRHVRQEGIRLQMLGAQLLLTSTLVLDQSGGNLGANPTALAVSHGYYLSV
jgi:hypothetical protein